MEFEKLQNIIADVLNIDKSKITPETTFPDDAAESIVTVNDAVVQIQNATNK